MFDLKTGDQDGPDAVEIRRHGTDQAAQRGWSGMLSLSVAKGTIFSDFIVVLQYICCSIVVIISVVRRSRGFRHVYLCLLQVLQVWAAVLWRPVC